MILSDVDENCALSDLATPRLRIWVVWLLLILLSSCASAPVVEGHVRAEITGISAGEAVRRRDVSGFISNDTSHAVDIVVARIAVYDENNYREQTIYVSEGPLQAGDKVKFTSACLGACLHAEVEEINAQ
jgi:hypothetical protein